MAKTKHLSFERLEHRNLRAAFSSPWPEVDSLSLSFVPDGTPVGAVRSNLQQSLAQVFNDSDWQLEILKAFQSWARATNANIALSDDNGSPIGTLGFKQGDVRFGDVRIGAFSMEEDVLAVANPYDPFIANTWVGDIFLNSDNKLLGYANSPAKSLYSIMLHEAGHVFGIGHSQDTASPMFPHFQDVESRLTTRDIELLQKLYGTRKIDKWEGLSGNDTQQAATLISFSDETNNPISPEWRGDLSSSSDKDFYHFAIPANTHSLDMHFNTKGISLLTGKLTISNAEGKVLATSYATDPRDNSFRITLQNLQPGEMLFAKVEAADTSVFGIGTYEILVTPHSTGDLASPPVGYVGENNQFHDGAQVLATTPGYVEHTYYEAEGHLSVAHPSQSYRVRSSNSPVELDNVFTVVIEARNTSIDDLQVTILDDSGNVVPFSTISRTHDEVALQVIGVKSDTDYLISIAAEESMSATKLANKHISYELEVDFAHDGAHLETLVSDSLDDSQPTFEKSFSVSKSSQFHFALSASDFANANNSDLRMDIIDSKGRTVTSMQVSDGATRIFEPFLVRGEYTIRFASSTRPIGSTIIFQWSGIVTSLPIGPQLRDTLSEPIESKTAAPIIAIQNYWLPDRSLMAGNDVQLRYIAKSADQLASTLPLTRFVSNENVSTISEVLEIQSTSESPSTILPERKDRQALPPKQSKRDPQLKNLDSFEQKSPRLRHEKSKAEASVNATDETPLPKESNTPLPKPQEALEADHWEENLNVFSSPVEPYIRWFMGHKSQSFGFVFALFTGIVMISQRRTLEHHNPKSDSDHSNWRLRLQRRW